VTGCAGCNVTLDIQQVILESNLSSECGDTMWRNVPFDTIILGHFGDERYPRGTVSECAKCNVPLDI